MPYFRFKPTMTIATYFPQLLKKEWWLGTKDTQSGTIYLVGPDLPATLQNLAISVNDVEAEEAQLPKEQ